MEPVCRLRLAPVRPQPETPRVRAGTATTSRDQACCLSVAPARRLRAHAPTCGGGATEPVESRKGEAPAVDRAARRLRAHAPTCGGGATEPVESRKDEAPAVDRAAEEAGLAPEELEVLEEAAITGEDEGRRPTDYDRRAHIFQESSRVFRELKQRSDRDDGGGGSQSGPGGVTN